jgi:two-component system response regulator
MTTSLPVNSFDVLLVEDDPGDVLMTREAFADDRINGRLHVVNDGIEAMAFLRREAPFTDVPVIDLVLLDLNLPRRNGIEVLTEIKADEDLRRIPVVVLTTSDAAEDILRSYNLYANAYVTKSVDFDRFVDDVRFIDDFFITVVRLPRRER